MKESNERKSWILVGTLLAAAVPLPVLASVSEASLESVRIEVSYADLDLDNVAGIDQLYRRLKSAAAEACGPTSLYSAGSVKQLRSNKTCYRDLLDRAVTQADNEALSRRHSG
jgi:UrcA family protein